MYILYVMIDYTASSSMTLVVMVAILKSFGICFET